METNLLIPGSFGASSEITMQAFKVKAGLRIFNTQGLGPNGCLVLQLPSEDVLPAVAGGRSAWMRRRVRYEYTGTRNDQET